MEKGVVCPAVGVPVGAGVLVIGGNYNLFRDNWVYDNWKIGFVQTWVPGLSRGDNRLEAQEESSHRNRYLANHVGVSPGGERMPNGIDYFWDGQGTGNCWQAAGGNVVEPLTLPSCPAGDVGRPLADPNLLVLFSDCGAYDLATQTLPPGCDWFQTPPNPGVLSPAITIQAVFPAIQLIAVLLLFGLRLRRSLLAFGAAALGSALLLVSSAEQLYWLTAPGIGLLGIAWILASRLVSSRRLAVLSVVLGFVALLEAVDSGVVLLPSPIAPVWVRVVLEAVWIVWALAAAVKPSRASVKTG